jgi:glycerate dehydrogenase
MNTQTSGLNVVFLDASSVDCGDVDLSRFDNSWNCTYYDETARAQTAERLAGQHVAVTNKVVIRADTMDDPRAADLKLIAIAATGTNNVDLDAARERGIAVCNVAGYSTAAVMQHTMGFILNFACNISQYSRDVRQGFWNRSSQFCLLNRQCIELDGLVLGIIGLGAIGKAVQGAAQAFGMNVIAAQRPGSDGPPPPGRTALDELLARSDFVSVHCPLTPETRGLIGAREIGLMKPTAYILNLARGKIVDEPALIDALRERRIAGAAFDVLSQEPPAPDHIMTSAAAELDNLIITPHTAWSARQARQRLLNEIAENIAAFERGEILNRAEIS